MCESAGLARTAPTPCGYLLRNTELSLGLTWYDTGSSGDSDDTSVRMIGFVPAPIYHTLCPKCLAG